MIHIYHHKLEIIINMEMVIKTKDTIVIYSKDLIKTFYY
jgi:hypothetical protein